MLYSVQRVSFIHTAIYPHIQTDIANLNIVTWFGSTTSFAAAPILFVDDKLVEFSTLEVVFLNNFFSAKYVAADPGTLPLDREPVSKTGGRRLFLFCNRRPSSQCWSFHSLCSSTVFFKQLVNSWGYSMIFLQINGEISRRRRSVYAHGLHHNTLFHIRSATLYRFISSQATPFQKRPSPPFPPRPDLLRPLQWGESHPRSQRPESTRSLFHPSPSLSISASAMCGNVQRRFG